MDRNRQARIAGIRTPLTPPIAAPVLVGYSGGMDSSLLLHCAAHYLGRALHEGKPIDPVARFHLGNGARVERLNWAGDPSSKGLKQSFGLMVNYLYDLKRLDKHRTQLAQGQVPVSKEISALLLD